MKTIDKQTTIHALLDEHPDLLDYLVRTYPEFHLLKNAAARATMGRLATLERVAGIAKVSVDQLIRDITDHISGGTNPDTPPAAEADRPAKTEQLKNIIRSLHAGVDVAAAKTEFASLLQAVAPEDIAQMEQELIREGMPVQEIHRLCDLHVNVFQSGLDRQEDLAVPAGHPLHTYQIENQIITHRAQRWTDLCRQANARNCQALAPELRVAIEELAQVNLHYTRKENQLFPYLEKHGFSGPSQVMWALHDDVRQQIKELRAAIERGDADCLLEKGVAMARIVSEMIYKEEKILFPNAWRMLTEAEWAEIRRGDDEIGYLTPPAAGAPVPAAAAADDHLRDSDLIPLTTGALTREQLDLMLCSMPVEFSFVDDQDTVRYYSGQAERVFPRSPGVIGRNVENCHPPKSLDAVREILRSFRDGTKSRAEFWINFQERFLYITYHAVRDAGGRYLGTLEVTTDATRIRQLQGERRLLEWT